MKVPGFIRKMLGLDVDLYHQDADAAGKKRKKSKKVESSDSGDEFSGTIHEQIPDNLEGLSSREAIQAHQAWSQRLKQYIDGDSDEQLDADVVSCDDKCVLGKWIHGTALPKYGHLNEAGELRDHHAQFHKIAGNIIRLHHDGETNSADQFLPALRNKSVEVQAAIGLLHKAIK